MTGCTKRCMQYNMTGMGGSFGFQFVFLFSIPRTLCSVYLQVALHFLYKDMAGVFWPINNIAILTHPVKGLDAMDGRNLKRSLKKSKLTWYCLRSGTKKNLNIYCSFLSN
ncbi:hypothetical protein EGW08_022139 [Elysia chlorotica]|uniref:Uncharacterized protein n=1 Tax=Elysia chlorotica TaxID=188477 RepID=A0A3S1B273_ELYCH|nr:hypothetical protein EGW08_022139 [Elysia chlorotica]